MKYMRIGAGCDYGVHVDGASFGPSKLLNKQDENTLLFQQEVISKSKDRHDLRKNFKELYDFSENLYKRILEVDADFVTMVGGDHSLAIPSALASLKKHPNIGMIWVDAHTDYHTLDTTSSGNLHGLPCACINGFGKDDLYKYHEGPFIDPKNTVIFGARSVDDPEWTNAKETGICIITMEEIVEKGIEASFQKAVQIACANKEGFHLSFDLDFLDPSVAPGVSTPVKHGATMEMLESLLKEICNVKSSIVSFDLVEFNPLNDKEDRTLKIAQRILNTIEG